MAEPAAKLSISLPLDLAKAVRERVGDRGVSSFIARALQHELEREQLGAFLDELDREHGPVSRNAASQARRAWKKR